MSSALPSPPDNGPSLIQTILAGVRKQGDLQNELFGAPIPSDVALGEPCAVLNMTLDAIRAGKFASAAELSAWRYPLTSAGTPSFAAIADLALIDGSWGFSGLSGGPVAQTTVAALNRYSADRRFVQAPALYFIAMWQTSGDFVPVICPEDLLKPLSTYSKVDVETVLKELGKHYQTPPR